MNNTVRITKALSDEIRLRIISILSCCDLYVCEIVEILELPQSTISRHLTILREASIISSSKKGSWINYTLVKNDAYEAFIKDLIMYAFSKEEKYINDLNRTKNRISKNRGCQDGRCEVILE